MIARPATPGAWVDTAAKCTPHIAQAIKEAGKVGVFRYVPLPGNASLGDISGGELGLLLDTGLEVGLVQHCRRPPVQLKLYSGQYDGKAASSAAMGAGYPPGCHVFLDLEGAAGLAADIYAYCDSWSVEVLANGYKAGLYVGYSAILSPGELYMLPRFDCYWSDAGPRTVATRGFAIKQHSPEVTIAGVNFDPDTVAPDALGELPIICASA